MDNEEVDFKLDGDAGHDNVYIKIGTAYNVNPKATKVENTFIIGSHGEAQAAVREALGGQTTAKPPKPEEEIDITPIRTEILNYVSCVRPLVAPEKKAKFMKMWKGILELDAIKPFVYKTGKQKETNFNRKLIANILKYLDSRKMYKDPYSPSTFAKALEGDSDKSVRGELGKSPSPYMCSEIGKYLDSIGM